MRKQFIALLIICISLIVASFYHNGYRRTWRQIWNLQTYSSPFLDMRVITGSAESLAAGYDPRVNNFYDPIHREFNYPLIWYPVLESGIKSNWTIPLAVAAIVLFFAGLILFPGKLNYLSIFLLLLITFSSTIMLGVERANVDLIFFFLVSMAIVLLEVSATASFIFLAVGILFKIFPVFAIGLFLDRVQKSSFKYVACGVIFAALYFIIMFADMMSIFRLTPKDDRGAYGVEVLSVHLSKLFPLDYSFLSIISYLISAVIILAILYVAFRNRDVHPSSDLRNLRAFWAGAGIYIGTFLLGNSYDYRLMFLLFAVPQLTEWAFQAQRTSWVARIVLLALALSCWYGVITGKFLKFFMSDYGFAYYINQFMEWILFAGLSYLFIVSLPEWVWIGWKRMLSKMRFSANN